MSQATTLEHMHEDIEILVRDIALIKQALLEEGVLTDEAVARLEKARKIPLSEYKEL